MAAAVQAQNAQAQIQAQRAAIQQQQLQRSMEQEDEKFAASVAHENPEVVQRAAEKIAEIAEEHGVDRAALQRLWNEQPVLRLAPIQALLMDGARSRIAKADCCRLIGCGRIFTQSTKRADALAVARCPCSRSRRKNPMANESEFRGLLTEALERPLPKLPQLTDEQFDSLVCKLYAMGELVYPRSRWWN
jgi:hypothetical protein